MLGEIIVLAVLEYKYSAFGKDILFKDKVWNFCKILQCVRRIGEDEIKLLLA